MGSKMRSPQPILLLNVLAADCGRFVRRVAAAMGSSTASVATSRASRLRARSPASSQSIAAYRSSSSTGSRFRVSASVSRAVAPASPRAVASFEPGSRMRAATIASTRARCGDGSGSSSRSRRSWRRVPSTAATWPCGSERTTSKAASRRGTAVPPLSRTRSPSTRVGGHVERLARVRLRTLPASRQDSRRRMAGGEERLGTASIYMATLADPDGHMNPAKTSAWLDKPATIRGNFSIARAGRGVVRLAPWAVRRSAEPGAAW